MINKQKTTTDIFGKEKFSHGITDVMWKSFSEGSDVYNCSSTTVHSTNSFTFSKLNFYHRQPHNHVLNGNHEIDKVLGYLLEDSPFSLWAQIWKFSRMKFLYLPEHCNLHEDIQQSCWLSLLMACRRYRVIHKSLRDFRTRLRNNQDRHGRKEHINR